MVKTYYITNTLESRYPIEFRQSRDPKYVVFQNCRCVYNNPENRSYLVSDVQIHADWIERDKYLDSFAGFTNTILTKYKKWQIISPRETFTIWFTDMEGNSIPVITKAEEDAAALKAEQQKAYEEYVRSQNLNQPPTNALSIAHERLGFTAGTMARDTTEEEEDNQPKTYISSFVLELLLIY
jgi:hypothetical protein